MTRTAFIVCLSLAIATTAIHRVAAAEGDGFVPLFDGKTLEGWNQKGGKAKYEVIDGVIVGTSAPKTPNSFLCTNKAYGDFVLEYEFKVDQALNSGVQIRSHSLADYKDGRVHGYQVEIDPNKPDRLWAGGIYDEARRGWLFPGSKGGDGKTFTEQGQRIYKKGDWNQVRVEAKGHRIRTWLNGEARADFEDDVTASGFIGLQVHGVGNKAEPLKARWRNLRIKELGGSAAGGWKKLFDGKTFAGWEKLPGGEWVVEEGKIIGRQEKTEKRHGMLLSKDRFDDFTVRLKYKAIQGNSGLYFRVDRVKGNVSVHGFQAEIDPARDAGGLYETGGRAWVVKPTAEQVKQYFKPGDWNTMTVTAIGRDVTVTVNGHTTASLKNDPGRTAGHIGLQLHGGQAMHVEFKDLEIRRPSK